MDLNFLIIFAAGVVASSYGTLVGGGSLITIPVLMLLGLPPHTAIGTDRLGITGLGIAGWWKFHQKRMIDYRIGVTLGIPTFLGSLLGAMLVLEIDPALLKRIIATFTVMALVLTAVKPKIGIEKTQRTIGRRHYLWGIFFGFLVGGYGGFYGPMASTFLAYVLIFLFGQTFLEGAASVKIATVLMTSVAALVFAIHGAVDYTYAAVLFTGCFIGSYLGAHYSDRIGNIWMKRVFIVVVLIMVIKLLGG